MHYLVKSSVSAAVLLSLSACIFEDTNTEPVASSVSLGSNDGLSTFTINNSVLLDNVTDDDAASLSITEVAIVSGNGELTQQTDSWSYQPAINDLGDVSFSYTVSDGEFTATSTATLSVANDNRVQLNVTDGITIYSELNNSLYPNAKATLYIGDETYEITTSATNGTFTFINVPNNSGYLLEIDDLDDNYATMFYASTAEAVDIPSSKELNLPELGQPNITSVNLLDSSTGVAISGLEPYILINEFVDPDGEIANIPAKKVYLEESNSTYSFFLDTNNAIVNVYLDSLEDASNTEYTLLANEFSLPTISAVSTGASDNVYFTKEVDNNFTVTVVLKNAADEAFDAGPLLSFYNRTTGEVEYWEKIATTLNQYTNTLTASEIIQSRVLEPIDTTEDGIIDYHAVTSSDGFPLFQPLSISDFTDSALTVDQIVDATDYNSPLEAQRISRDIDFQANGNTQVTFAFDRAIDTPSTVQVTTKVLTSSQPLIDLNTSATIYNEEQDTTVTTDQGQASIELEYDNTYLYVNKDGTAVAVTLGVDGSDQTVSPYITEYGSSEETSALSSTNYILEANNTLLTIALSPYDVEPLFSYTFEVTVDAPYDNNNASTFNFDLRALTNATTSLSDLSIDNFDFKDANTLDITDTSTEAYLNNMAPQTDTFFELNVGYVGGSASDRAQLSYLELNINSLDDVATFNSNAGVDSSENTVYLVSTAPITGDVSITSQVEVRDNSGSAESETFAITGNAFTLTLDSSSTDTNPVVGKTAYIANHQQNHGVDDTGINDVLGISLVSGANVDEAGIYYIYQLPATLQNSGRIEQVELSFDVIIAGASVTGTETYYVK